MRKTILAVLGASLIVVSAVQIAGAAERHSHRSDSARATEQFRNANGFVASPSVEQQNRSDYSEGHVISAPAGQ